MIYFISDFHFGHAKVIEYANRPFADVSQMNSFMTDKYNQVIAQDDLVYIVGDFCLGNITKVKGYLSALNGKKILIRGNHDRGSNSELKKAGFTDIKNSDVLSYEGYKIGVSHYPFKRPGEMLSKYNLSPLECDFLIHGHVHDLYNTKVHESSKLMLNVSVEALNYSPISIERVIKEFEAKAPTY